jgi:hypothetical protein
MSSIFAGILHIWFASFLILINTNLQADSTAALNFLYYTDVLATETLKQQQPLLSLFFSIVIPTGIAEIAWSLPVIKKEVQTYSVIIFLAC